MLEWTMSKRWTITHADMHIEKRVHLGTIGGILNWYNHYRKQYEEAWKKNKGRVGHKWATELNWTYDARILLLEIDPKEIKILTRKYIFTLIFIAALFIISKTW